MFENEIKFINDFILNKTKDLGSLFTIEKFLSADIHPSIKKYVEGEINYLIYQDRKKLIDNSLFDYSGAKISNYFNLIADEIKKTKKVTYEDIKNIILQAVSFNANFVVRPKWALSKLIFGDSKSVSLNDVQMMLNYTYYYEYINNVFLAYMAKKKIMNISPTEFELIMNKIDRELFTLHQSKLVDNALYAIADFYNIGGLSKSSISAEAVEVFLKEKNLTELLFKLKRGFPSPTKKKNDIDDIRKVLYSAFPVELPFIEDKKTEEEIKSDKHFENPLKEVPVTDDTSMEENEISENEDSQIQSVEQSTNDIFQEEVPSNETTEELKEVENVVESADEQAINLTEENNIPEDEEIVKEEIAKEIKPSRDIIEDKTESTNEAEEILNSFTEDLEKNQEEEIIILDEKEEENLLDFYDNEVEITIDDDLKKDERTLDILNQDENEQDTILRFDEVNLPPENEIEIEVDENNLESPDKIEFDHEEKSSEEKIKDELLKEEQEQSKPVIDKKNFDDIFSFLSRKEIDRIIKNLFNSDSEDFANTVEKMSACDSLDDAMEILNNLFKYLRIKPHSKDADALTKAVTKYFNQAN